MTSAFALHLIEQFAAQAPFAVWITDSRGVGIFANKRLHEMLDIPDHPSGALGVNLFDDPAVAHLHLGEAAKRVQDGQFVDLILDLKDPGTFPSSVLVRRKEPITLKVSCYSLHGAEGKAEHYVILMSDITEKSAQREKLRRHLHDLGVFNGSRGSRLARLAELQAEADTLEDEIRRLGAVPADATAAQE